MGRDCVGELGWQYGTRLKSHGAVTNWCTRRGWPVNCMTLISAWWWSNMPSQRRREVHIPLVSNGKRLSGRKTITRCTGSSSQLEIRCGRENQHPAEGALRTPDWAVGVQSLKWVGEKIMEWEACPNKGWAPRPLVEQPRRTGKKHCYGHKSGGSICCSSVHTPTPSHTTLSIKWEVYFSKDVCPLVFIASLYSLHRYILHASAYEYTTQCYILLPCRFPSIIKALWHILLDGKLSMLVSDIMKFLF